MEIKAVVTVDDYYKFLEFCGKRVMSVKPKFWKRLKTLLLYLLSGGVLEVIMAFAKIPIHLPSVFLGGFIFIWTWMYMRISNIEKI